MKEQPTHQSAATRGIGVAPSDAREMTEIVLAPGHWGPRKPQNRVPPRQRVAETDLSTPIGIIDDSGAKLATFEILLPGSVVRSIWPIMAGRRPEGTSGLKPLNSDRPSRNSTTGRDDFGSKRDCMAWNSGSDHCFLIHSKFRLHSPRVRSKE